MRTNLGNAKDPASGLSAAVNYSPADYRFTALLNLAIQNLATTGEMFWGLFGRYAFCVDNSCLTWPRQIASIQSVAVCDQPIPVRSGWFEFLESGYGIQGDDDCGNGSCGNSGLLDRGTACTFADIIGTNKKIKVYADVTESVGSYITLQGNDQNGQWIRTQVGGEWIDGEQVLISTTPQTSTKIFTSLVASRKPVTNGSVRLYEYDTTLLTQRALAVYEPDETNPVYRRSYVPGLPHGCCGEGDCELAKVTVMAKHEFIPVVRDEDWLLIGNLPALECEMQSIMFRRSNNFKEMLAWHAQAVQILRGELSHYRGSGVVQPIRMAPRNIGGAAVANMI